MKQGNLKKKVGSLLLAAAMVVTSFPSYSKEVHAAGNTLPDVSQFATVDDLKSFNTNDKDGEVNAAKVYFGKNSQQWWIAGSQSDIGVTLFAASPVSTTFQFEYSFDNEKPYDETWGCEYVNMSQPPESVWTNHYGGSYLRNTYLKTVIEPNYFSKAELELMNYTTIYTNDAKNSDGNTTGNNDSVYSTKDKLHLAYGYRGFIYVGDPIHNYVTVGENSYEDLESGLRVDSDYYGDGKNNIWLRSPSTTRGMAHIIGTDDVVAALPVASSCKLLPAFELDLSAVSFASAAPAASSDGNLALQDTDGDGAFTLRYKSPSKIGTAAISQSKQSVVVTGITNENTYLVVQNKDGAWSKKVADNDLVFADEMAENLTSFENCKVWLETTNERITYASEATHGNGYHVSVVGGEDLNVTGGMQTNVSADISDITIEVADGYYLPDTYIDSITGLNGLTITKTDTGFTISGTPTSDVKLILSPATPLPKAEKPAVELKTTSTSITVTVTNHKTEFGDIEYKWDDGNWEKNKNTLSDLEPNTTHQLAVRYKGDGFYQTSEEFTATITTLQDGNTVVIEPKDVTAIYSVELKLADVRLPEGWVWVEEDTALSAGTGSYPAVFDTAAYEDTTDFLEVDGYDKDTQKVTRKIEVKVAKAESEVEITTQSLDKVYDGRNAVNDPQYTTSGSNGKVTITWQKNTGTSDTPNWEDLKSAPSTVGNYQVVVELAGSDNYNSASATLEFVISQATNAWTEELSITGWTYNEKANIPSAKAQFGDVAFTYSGNENGTYTSEVPKNAGTWYVKASVAEDENYTGLESAPAVFVIAKAVPTPEKVTGLVLGQGQPLSKIKLPKQFKWVDETLIANDLGTHTFKAVYTPEDTANYETIEVEIAVEVVPTQTAVNHVPTISAKDKTITVGDKFEPLKDVTASDKEDGDLTSKIKVIDNTVNTKKAGIYEVTYQVTDSQGASVTKTSKVTVKAETTSIDPDKNKSDNAMTDIDKEKGSVETGDETNHLLWGLLLIGSSIILIHGLYRKKTKMK